MDCVGPRFNLVDCADDRKASPRDNGGASPNTTRTLLNADSETGNDALGEFESLDVDDFPEDTYGVAIASVVRDSQRIARGSMNPWLRRGRISLSLGMLFMNMGTQVFLMTQIKEFVTAKSVHDIRFSYADYEEVMYDKVYYTANDHARGVSGFHKERFYNLTEADQSEVCRIPFSQPYFFYVILVIWSLSVVGEIKSTANLFTRLIIYTPITSSMMEATRHVNEGNYEVVAALTVPIKVGLTVFVLIPRMLIACILLWLGCRWLTATSNFSDLLLNAVALEFVLMLKDLLYTTLVPIRNKRDALSTKLDIAYESSHPSAATFFGAFFWLIACLTWVFAYANYFQQVLPDYKFDVQEVCKKWIEKRYALR